MWQSLPINAVRRRRNLLAFWRASTPWKTSHIEEKSFSTNNFAVSTKAEFSDEYMGKLSLSGQPGFGDAFLRWAWDNQANPERSEQVEIHFRGNDGEDYEEFPDDSALDKFDPSDRKFVAVALGSKAIQKILNAVDRDWWNYRKELERHGVRIKFLCPGQFGTRRPAG